MEISDEIMSRKLNENISFSRHLYEVPLDEMATNQKKYYFLLFSDLVAKM